MSRRARMLCSVTKPRDATKPRSGSRRRGATSTTAFGAGRREGHDASAFYSRFAPPKISDDETVNRPGETLEQLGRGRVFNGSGAEMSQLPDNSVALVVTSPPYFVGKEYEAAVTGSSAAGSDPALPTTYLDYLEVLREVFAECTRVLEPGGRIAVNVANLGRKPYRSLSADVVDILGNDLGLLLRGEIIWEKSETSSGSCAWGSFAKASNPVLRDMTERVVIASKGRFSRALSAAERTRRGLPVQSTLTNDEFMEVTRDVWRIDAESARRVGHPAPFPVDLPRRLIDLYTYSGDIVVDPFNGSGTTVVAAARTGRIGVGYDLDADYVALAEQRLAQELERVDDSRRSRSRSQTLIPMYAGLPGRNSETTIAPNTSTGWRSTVAARSSTWPARCSSQQGSMNPGVRCGHRPVPSMPTWRSTPVPAAGPTRGPANRGWWRSEARSRPPGPGFTEPTRYGGFSGA